MRKIVLLLSMALRLSIPTMETESAWIPDGGFYPRIEIEEGDVDLMARVIMSEAGGCDWETKVAVGSVIVNRVISDLYPDTIREVVFQRRQFSTHNNGTPTAECREAAKEALTSWDVPEDVLFFRSGHFHTWATDWKALDRLYFSTR